MGNYRFRLSDMIPNAWFYKLKDMNKSRNQQKIVYHHHVSKKKPHHTSSSSSSFSSSSSSSSSLSSKERQQQQQQLSHQRKSYYFSRDLSTATASAAAPPGAERDNAETKTTRISDGKSSSSSKKRRSGARRNRVSNRVVTTTTSSVATAGGCSCRATVESVWSKPDSTTPEEYPISPLDTTSSSSSSDENEAFTLPEFGSNNMNMNMPCFAPEKFDTMLSWSSTTYCPGSKLGKKDTRNEPFIAKFQEPSDDDKRNGIGIDTISQFNLPPIITNHQSSKTTSKKMESLTLANTTVEDEEEPTKIRRDYGGLATGRRFSSGNYSSQGLKLRTNSPRIVNRRRIQLQGRKSVSKPRSRKSMSESFAVVKSSKDPQRDFRDSMLEMIIENNLCASKDLEDLLACYLSLNSDEYHDLIITVFKQIWFDIIDIHPN